MPHLLEDKTKVTDAVIHPDVEPIFKLFGQLPRNLDLIAMPSSFFEQFTSSIRLEGILDKKTLYVTGPIDKIALLNCPLIDLVRKDTLLISKNIKAKTITEKVVTDAWITLLHSVMFSINSGCQLGILLDLLNNQIPAELHILLLNHYKTTEPEIGKWANVSRAAVQRQVKKWRDHKTVTTTDKSFLIQHRQ